MKQKVGLITIHYVDNLGGVLLAYALQESVNQLGYVCYVIDYDPTHIPSKTRHLLRSITRRVIRLPLYFLDFPKYLSMAIKNRGVLLPPLHLHGSSGLRKKKFVAFRERYINLSEQHYTTDYSLISNPPIYDAYVCGSDQVWNPFMCKNPENARNEPAYFLKFAPEAKRISYAPSISIPEIPEHLREEMKQFLMGIPYLSCREKQGSELIRKMTGRSVEVVLDPTLLLDCEEWGRIAVDPEIKEPYVLGYFLGDGVEYRSFAQELAKRLGYRLVVISRDHKDSETLNALDWCDAGPAEFLGLVMNAGCVCTDSFHGTIFSINFSRPFYAFERPGSHGTQSMATRIYNILELVGLTHRLLKTDSHFPTAPLEIDFTEPHLRLLEERARSLQYLESSLFQATSY